MHKSKHMSNISFLTFLQPFLPTCATPKSKPEPDEDSSSLTALSALCPSPILRTATDTCRRDACCSTSGGIPGNRSLSDARRFAV